MAIVKQNWPADRMTNLNNLDVAITKMIKGFSVIATICMILVMLIAVADIVLAKFLKTALPGAPELIENLNIPLVFLAAAFVQVDRGHTRITLLLERFPAVVQRAIKLLGHFLGIVLCSFFCWLSINKLQNVIEIKASADGAWPFPLWPFVASLVLGFVLMTIAFALTFIREIRG